MKYYSIGEFKIARSHFITMGVAFEEDEMVHLLIWNPPLDGVWLKFKQLLTQCAQDHLDRSANLDPPPPPDTLLNIVITRISIECNSLESSRLETHRHLLASMPAHQQSAFVSTPTRECHGFVNPCGLMPWVPAGAGTGWEFVTLAQPVPVTWV